MCLSSIVSMNSYHVRIIIQRLSEHQSNLSIVIARINTTHSCNDDGNTQGEFISNSSIHNTFNKGITIHGTNDVDLDNNVVFDHIGHGIFLEDGNEIRTEVTNNLVFVTRRAPNGASVPSDVSDPSSYWIEHPNNTFTGNTAAGSAEVGFWLFGNNAPHGDSAGQPIPPGDWSDLVFDNNTAHSSEQAYFVEGSVRADGSVRGGPFGCTPEAPQF